jgi:hypothetical protein
MLRMLQVSQKEFIALQLLHCGVDLQIGATQELVRYASTLLPFLGLANDSTFVVTDKTTGNRHLRTLGSDLASLGYGLMSYSVTVEKNPSLSAHMQYCHLAVAAHRRNLLLSNARSADMMRLT